MLAAGLERSRKHTPVIPLLRKSLRPCFSIVARQKVSCMKDVFTLGYVVSWDEITCTELLFLTGGGEDCECGRGKKYLVLSF